ncbi:unnamed protein product [Symbiodinium natans]|uniref:GDT1 family protein n=1 Tax=Symbiodinium natans TaxID=878477 RepID=A0A812H621_9DINO|nr:unnamed protein product [Symbiodinium natans]
MAVGLLQAAGLAFLAEVGDASFFVAVILAIFCPWRGVRSLKTPTEYVLVVLGSTSALLLRVLLRSLGLRVFVVAGELLPPLLAASVLAVLSVLAYLHWAAARGDPEPGAVSDRSGAPPARCGGSFLGSFQAYNPAAYVKSEALEQQPLLAGLVWEQSRMAKAPGVASMLLAFLVPFSVIFLLETGSQGFELEVPRSNLPGSLCGLLAANVLAAFVGFTLERHVDDQVLLLVAALGLGALCIGSLQTAALRYLAAAYAPKLSRSLRSVQ